MWFWPRMCFLPYKSVIFITRINQVISRGKNLAALWLCLPSSRGIEDNNVLGQNTRTDQDTKYTWTLFSIIFFSEMLGFK